MACVYSSAFSGHFLYLLISLVGTACQEPSEDLIVSVDVVDRVGLFESKTWKTKKTEVVTHTRQATKALKGFHLGTSDSVSRQWQLTLSFEQASESASRSDAQGRIPKDHVFRQLDFSLRLKSLSRAKLDGRNAEHSIRHVHRKNYPVFSSPQLAVTDAINRGMELLNFEMTLQNESDRTIVKMLGQSKPGRRPYVISQIRRRKLASAVDDLIAILNEPKVDQESELEIIGALISIGDPRAVGPLINSAQRRPDSYLTQIIFGVAEIGGKQAEAYLFTLKAGHPKASIRRHAVDALNELNRRKGTKDE